MTTEQFFETELHVHFTRSELSTIMSALFTESRNELKEGRKVNAEVADAILIKVKEFCKIYDNSAVL